MKGLSHYVIEVNQTEDPRASVCMVPLVAMSNSHDAAILHKGEKRQNYDISFKLEATEYAEKVSHKATVKKCNVDVKHIHEWHNNNQSIAGMKEKHVGQGRKKVDGGGANGCG